MDKEKVINASIMASLTAVAGFSAGVTLDEDSLNGLYICDTTLDIQKIEMLSTDFAKGFYFDKTTGQMVTLQCSDGVWGSLLDYMDENGISIEDLFQVQKQNTAKKLQCNPTGCIEIN